MTTMANHRNERGDDTITLVATGSSAPDDDETYVMDAISLDHPSVADDRDDESEASIVFLMRYMGCNQASGDPSGREFTFDSFDDDNSLLWDDDAYSYISAYASHRGLGLAATWSFDQLDGGEEGVEMGWEEFKLINSAASSSRPLKEAIVSMIIKARKRKRANGMANAKKTRGDCSAEGETKTGRHQGAEKNTSGKKDVKLAAGAGSAARSMAKSGRRNLNPWNRKKQKAGVPEPADGPANGPSDKAGANFEGGPSQDGGCWTPPPIRRLTCGMENPMTNAAFLSEWWTNGEAGSKQGKIPDPKAKKAAVKAPRAAMRALRPRTTVKLRRRK